MTRLRLLASVLHASIEVKWYRPAQSADGSISLVRPVYGWRRLP